MKQVNPTIEVLDKAFSLGSRAVCIFGPQRSGKTHACKALGATEVAGFQEQNKIIDGLLNGVDIKYKNGLHHLEGRFVFTAQTPTQADRLRPYMPVVEAVVNPSY
ncbi:hypothetical protein NVP1032O_72 [Vibrio phage 1.032.O._10N.261.54.F5]|nr:hypothetical protein NVP1032O_72 [Vibrio phage 1.032.O._10N.261.54.F5]